jgi:hypothetical protein
VLDPHTKRSGRPSRPDVRCEHICTTRAD